MAIDSIIRTSFESSVTANQAVNSALVGHQSNSTGPGPYQKIGTALYTCSNANEADVGKSILELGVALANNAQLIDFVSITIARR